MSHEWTFLSHQAHVLLALSENSELTMDQLAGIAGLTTRSMVNVLSDLVDGGYLEKSKTGRNNHYSIVLEAPLRHETSPGRTVGDLIQALGRVGKRQ